MNKKELFDNPLDDFVPGPTLLDKASAALADQLSNAHEHVAVIEEATSHIPSLESRVIEPASRPIYTEEMAQDDLEEAKTVVIPPSRLNIAPNIFSGECPDFGVGNIKQAILNQQWEFCRNRWTANGGAMMSDINSRVQETIFATVVAIVRNLSIEQFVGIQPVEHEVSKLFYLQPGRNLPGEIQTDQTINMIATMVEVYTRKFITNWTIEADMDFKARYGDDHILELAKILAAELTVEIYLEFIEHISKTTHKAEFMYTNDERTSLWIYKEAANIAGRSLRGKANKLIASNSMVAALVRTKDFRVEDNIDKRYGHMTYVGKLGNIQVFSDHNMPPGKAMLMYKGEASEIDAGVYYCPYQMIATSGISVNPTTFQSVMSLFTRYGVATAQMRNEDGDTTDALSNYATQITITNLEYSVEDDRMLTELFKDKPIGSALIGTSSLYSPNMPIRSI